MPSIIIIRAKSELVEMVFHYPVDIDGVIDIGRKSIRAMHQYPL